MLGCEVLERDADGRGSLVRMKVDAKVHKIEYIVRYSYDLPNSFGWKQVSGDLAENTSKYTISPRGDGSTDVTLDIVSRSASSSPGPVQKLIRDQAMKNSLRELKRHLGA